MFHQAPYTSSGSESIETAQAPKAFGEREDCRPWGCKLSLCVGKDPKEVGALSPEIEHKGSHLLPKSPAYAIVVSEGEERLVCSFNSTTCKLVNWGILRFSNDVLFVSLFYILT